MESFQNGFNPDNLSVTELMDGATGATPLHVIGAVQPPKPASPGIPRILEQLGDGDGGKKQHNAGTWLDHVESHLTNPVRFNDLTRMMEFDGDALPVDEMSLLYVHAQRAGHLVQEKVCQDGLLAQAYAHRYDPIKDYLLHVEQDDSIKPVPLSSLSQSYLGTTDPLYDAMLKVAVLGAVHRRMDPGSQFDVVVVLKGDQGIRKSTFWKVLASPAWYCCSVPDSDLNLLLNVHSTWMYELAELENVTTKKDVGQLKNLITTSTDHIRVPYGKAMEEKSRKSVFVSSVNGDAFLRDETGHRRFLVIECPQRFEDGELIDTDKIVRDRDRIWKAAMLAYRNDELPMLSCANQLDSNTRNSGFEIESPFEGPIDRWLAAPSTPDRFTSDLALTLSGCRSEGQIKRNDQMEVANLLTKLGWSKPRDKETVNGIRGRFWKKLPDRTTKPSGGSQVGAEVGQQQIPVPNCPSPLNDQPDQLIKEEIERDTEEGGSVSVPGMLEKGWSVGHLPDSVHSPLPW